MKQQRAIVLGAGIAGLFTARVLSNHFDEVFVLERDSLKEEDKLRAGVPQARHLHQILAKGQTVMQELFPTLAEDLATAGSPELHWGVDNIIFNENGQLPAVESGIITNTCSRTTLEGIIRKRLLEYKNVQILENHRVQCLIASPDNKVIQGVRFNIDPDKGIRELYADLIVDATGKSSKSPQWYQDLGYPEPDSTYINAHVGYSTCWFEIKPEKANDFVMIQIADLISDPPPGKGQRSGVIIKMEENRFAAILTSNNKDYPPTDLEGFLEFSRTLRSDTFYNLLKDATALTPVYGSRSTYNLWNHYEKLDTIPENYLIIGDAVCSLNPLFGQGMTVAALEAQLLDNLLSERAGMHFDGFAQQFQKKLAKNLGFTWELSTAKDKITPGVEGDVKGATIVDKAQSIYFEWVLQAMEHDKDVLIAFFEVLNMIRTPLWLVQPHILFRVLRHKITGYSNMDKRQ